MLQGQIAIASAGFEPDATGASHTFAGRLLGYGTLTAGELEVARLHERVTIVGEDELVLGGGRNRRADRIISARRATSRERKLYAEAIL